MNKYENLNSDNEYAVKMSNKILDMFNVAIVNKKSFVIDGTLNRNIGKTEALRNLAKMHNIIYLNHRDKCLSFAYKYTPVVLLDEVNESEYEKLTDVGLICVGFIRKGC